jgi:uncharacterized membrane protein
VRTRWEDLQERSSVSVLPVPAVAAAAAVVLGVLLSSDAVDGLDDRIGESLWPGQVSVATDVLSLLAGSALTVLSLTVSVTIVALQLASQQFSPRLLRTFLEGYEVRIVISVFVALFVYCLAVLRGIEGDDPSAPQLALFVAFALAMGAVATLVWYIAYIVRLIRVDVMMRNAVRDSRATHAELVARPTSHAARPEPPEDAKPLPAPRSGFVGHVDLERAREFTSDHGAVVVIDVHAGDHVLEGEPLGFVWGTDLDCPDCVHIVDERSPRQDVALGLRQLTDIAIKALSPAVNDPTTATHAVTHASRVLVALAEEPLSALTVQHGERTSVWAASYGTVELLDGVTAQIRRYGSREPAVLEALLHLLHGVAHRTGDPEVHRWIEDEVSRIVAAAERDIDEPYDVEKVRSAAVRPRHLSGT